MCFLAPAPSLEYLSKDNYEGNTRRLDAIGGLWTFCRCRDGITTSPHRRIPRSIDFAIYSLSIQAVGKLVSVVTLTDRSISEHF